MLWKVCNLLFPKLWERMPRICKIVIKAGFIDGNKTCFIVKCSFCCIFIHMFMQKYTYIYIYWIHTDAVINRCNNKDAGRKTSLTKYLPLTLFVRVRKGLLNVCVWEGAGDRTETVIFWPQTYGRHVVSFLFFDAQPEAHGPLCWMMASFTHLISIFSGPQLIRAQRPRRPDVALPTTFRLQLSGTQLPWLLSWLSYIIVQRPLDHPRDLWNRMFNRHQAEITVMQFRGYSLPVRQSMRVSWDFFLPRPISSANFCPRDFLS